LLEKKKRERGRAQSRVVRTVWVAKGRTSMLYTRHDMKGEIGKTCEAMRVVIMRGKMK